MKNQTPTEQFTMISFDILSSTKLSSSQKLLVAYVIGWQRTNKTCTESNSSLARRLGLPLDTLKDQITNLNKLPFFKTISTSRINDFGKWSNSKEIKIDEEALNVFLSTSEAVKPQPIEKPTPVQPKSFIDELQELEDESSDINYDLSTALGKELGAVSTAKEPVVTLASHKLSSSELAEELNNQPIQVKLEAKRQSLGYSKEIFAEYLIGLGITV